MSARYIFSSLGFYPVAPGSTDYAIGSPAINSAKIHLENGHVFEMDVRDQSPANIYIQKMN